MSAKKILADLKKLGTMNGSGVITVKGARMMGRGIKAGDQMKVDMSGSGLFGSIFRGVKKVGDFTVKGVKALLDAGRKVGITPSALAAASGRPGIASSLKLVGQGRRLKGKGIIRSTDRGYYSPNSNITDKAVY